MSEKRERKKENDRKRKREKEIESFDYVQRVNHLFSITIVYHQYVLSLFLFSQDVLQCFSHFIYLFQVKILFSKYNMIIERQADKDLEEKMFDLAEDTHQYFLRRQKNIYLNCTSSAMLT
jgi:hypothetical protein